MTVVVNRRADFTLDSFRRVAFAREDVEIGPAARDAMAGARRGFLALLDSDRTAFIYGTTTRPGVEVATAVPPDEQREYRSEEHTFELQSLRHLVCRLLLEK